MKDIEMSIYRVDKEFIINDDTKCKVGDIIVVRENAYDAPVMNDMTQGFMCNFFNYDECTQIYHKWVSFEEYTAITNGRKLLPIIDKIGTLRE